MIKRIKVEDLRVGMFVEDFNVPWVEHPFATSKRKIKSPKDIQLILDHGIHEVLIDTDKGVDSPRAVSEAEVEAVVGREMTREAEAPEPQGPTREASPFDEEVKRAKVVYDQAKHLVKDMLQDVRMGRGVDGERTAQVVDGMVDSIFRNRDALSSLSRLKSFDDYTFHHSVNVSVLSLTLGRHLGLVQGELKRLGVGAILHDVGKMMVDEAILNKPGRLTDEEFAVMKTHTLHGARILMKADNVPEECSAVALNHHERFDGRGYPRGLSGLAIGKFGLISAIVDVYDAVTSDRVYHKGMPSHQAVQKIYEWGKTDFYPIYVQKFIQCLGIYPIGSVVRLDTGEVGVVCRQNPGQLLRPVVRVVLDALGCELPHPLEADLTEADASGAKPFARTVAGTLEPQACGFDVGTVLLGDGVQAAA